MSFMTITDDEWWELKEEIESLRVALEASESEASRCREDAGELRRENERLRNWAEKLEDMLPVIREIEEERTV